MPRANPFAKRCVATLRRECLDWILVRGRRHLVSVLHECLARYNAHRPHRSLGTLPTRSGTVETGGGDSFGQIMFVGGLVLAV